MTEQVAGIVLVSATALHAGFQIVVTLLVYPAFAEVPADHWPRHHAAHSRRITGIVVLIYGVLVAASSWVALAGPRNVGTLTAVACSAIAMLTTALVAAPAHRRITPVRGGRDLAMLVRADRLRLVAAVLAAGAAVHGVAL